MTTLAPACTPLPWDSDFFGVQIGRGTLPVQAADECAREQGLDCLYLLVPIEEMAEAHEAVRLGFRLVDVRVEFEIEPRPGHHFGLESRVRPLQVGVEDLTALGTLARASFHSTRFYNDPRFPDDECAELYFAWTMNACDGEADVLVAERDGKVCGYVTLTDDAEVGLIAVAKQARQQGVGRDLMNGALNWALLQEHPTLTVVTQGGNTAAQRLFQACGGRTSSVGLWFHSWYQR